MTTRLLSGTPGSEGRRGPARPHLLTWVRRLCGAPMLCTSTSKAAAKGRERRAVYRCREDKRGHVARDKASLDDFIERLVIARLSRPDAADLLAEDHRDELAGLHREAAAIRELMAADRRMHLARVLTEAEFADGRRQHQADLAAVEQQIADLGQADVIAPLIRDPAGAWEGLGLDQRRAVIAALMTIKVMPTRKGRPPGGGRGSRTSTRGRSRSRSSGGGSSPANDQSWCWPGRLSSRAAGLAGATEPSIAASRSRCPADSGGAAATSASTRSLIRSFSVCASEPATALFNAL